MRYRYDPSRKALVSPARDTSFFRGGRPASEPHLCAELSRLAYAPFERESSAREEVDAVLQGIGFTTCRFFSTASTQAFLAEDPVASVSVLAFRGTELDPRDWATDLNALLVPWSTGGQVHRGFAEALEVAWDPIVAALAAVTGRLLFTGHSLGAALATLSASRRAPHALHTFGSPRVGDAAFAEATAALNHHRFSHCCDVVCRLPPEAMNYRHTGPLAYLDRRGALHPMPSDQFMADDQRRARRIYLRHWAWRPGTMWTRDTADHAPVNYVAALSRLGVGERDSGEASAVRLSSPSRAGLAAGPSATHVRQID